MKKRIIVFVLGIMVVAISYTKMKQLTNKWFNDTIDINDDTEF